jgi:hypothetical protein
MADSLLLLPPISVHPYSSEAKIQDHIGAVFDGHSATRTRISPIRKVSHHFAHPLYHHGTGTKRLSIRPYALDLIDSKLGN